MQNQNITQLEMFNLDAGSSGENAASVRDPLRLRVVRGYQKLILKGIALIFISLAAFSLGVEKGKRQTVNFAGGSAQAPAVEAAAEAAVSRVAPVTTNAAADMKLVSGRPLQAVADVKPSPEKNNYTIQVASISKSKNAQSELSSLRNKGYIAFSLVKGKYTVICVGKFEEREDALGDLGKLKARYPDCQIRRL